MFLGHFGLALAVKGLRKDIPLWVLLPVSAAPDLLDPLFGAVGLDHDLWTHSAPAAAGYAVASTLAYGLANRAWRSALWVGALAGSHFVADLITSRLELWAHGPSAGLHLYLHPWADFALEAAVIAVGWLLYRRSLPASRLRHPVALAMLGVLIALQAVVAAVGVS